MALGQQQQLSLLEMQTGGPTPGLLNQKLRWDPAITLKVILAYTEVRELFI